MLLMLSNNWNWDAWSDHNNLKGNLNERKGKKWRSYSLPKAKAVNHTDDVDVSDRTIKALGILLYAYSPPFRQGQSIYFSDQLRSFKITIILVYLHSFPCSIYTPCNVDDHDAHHVEEGEMPFARLFSSATSHLRDISTARYPICATFQLRDIPSARQPICATFFPHV